MTLVVNVVLAVLALAAALLLVRIARGPSMLDRMIGLDALVAVAICGLGLDAAVDRDPTMLPILVVLALVGFVGSTSVARFTTERDDVGERQT